MNTAAATAVQKVKPAAGPPWQDSIPLAARRRIRWPPPMVSLPVIRGCANPTRSATVSQAPASRARRNKLSQPPASLFWSFQHTGVGMPGSSCSNSHTAHSHTRFKGHTVTCAACSMQLTGQRDAGPRPGLARIELCSHKPEGTRPARAGQLYPRTVCRRHASRRLRRIIVACRQGTELSGRRAREHPETSDQEVGRQNKLLSPPLTRIAGRDSPKLLCMADLSARGQGKSLLGISRRTRTCRPASHGNA